MRRGSEALAFYKAAFAAEELHVIEDPGGPSSPSCRRRRAVLDQRRVAEHGNFSPETLKGGTVRMILTVADPDAAFARAVAAGATVVTPVTEDYGWRVGRVVDPSATTGNRHP